MMRILITGATGFVGGHLSRAMVADGHEVFAIVRGSNVGRLAPEARPLLYEGRGENLIGILTESRPDVVIHAATKYLASHQPSDIAPLVQSNILFGTQLMDAMARHGIGKMINFGTSFQHFESDDYNPVSLYAASKQAFEAMLAYYVNAHNLSVVTLKLSDTYGAYDTRGKIITTLLAAAESGERVAMSPGQQILSLLHVDDAVAAVRVALARVAYSLPGISQQYAVRGKDLISLRDLVRLVEDASGKRVHVAWGERPYRDREVMHPWLGELLPSWEPAISLREGVKRLLNV